MAKMTVNEFLVDKPEGFKVEIGSKSGYFFYGTKKQFNEFSINGIGKDMYPLPGERKIKEGFISVVDPDYLVLLVEGNETGKYSFPGDSGEKYDKML